MIYLYIYLSMAIAWGIYNAIVEVPKYLKAAEYKGNSLSTFLFYLINAFAGAILFPISFYQKILKRRTKR